MAVIEKRKTTDGQLRYRVKIRLKGKPPQTETFHRLADAKRWAHETEVAIREDRYFKTVEAKKHTVGDLIDRYILDVMPLKKKSQKKQTAQLLWWKERIGSFTLAELTNDFYDNLSKFISFQDQRLVDIVNKEFVSENEKKASHKARIFEEKDFYKGVTLLGTWDFFEPSKWPSDVVIQ